MIVISMANSSLRTKPLKYSTGFCIEVISTCYIVTPNGFSKPIIVFNKFLKNHCLYRMRCKWFEIRLYWLFGYRYQIWEFFAVFHLIYFSSIVLLPQLGFTLNHIFCKIIELWWANKLVLGFMHYWLTIL